MSRPDRKDGDGNPCTLGTLCRTEPEWAASRIATLESDLATARQERDDALLLAEVRGAGCECGDDEACRFARERDEARGALERLRDEDAHSPVQTSGKHLGAVRRWIQWHCGNGERVTWDSEDYLEHHFTVSDLEEIAERIKKALTPPPAEGE